MREEIVKLSKEYFGKEIEKKKIIAGENYIPPSGKVMDEDDMAMLIDASLDMWLTAGRYHEQFEREFASKSEIVWEGCREWE